MRSHGPAEPLGELETTVMELVWALPSATAREVCDRLTGRRERAYTTIMTTMDRLHRKGLLTRDKEGLAWRYRAALPRARYEADQADALAESVLAAHGERALAAFVDAAARLEPSMLDRLAQLVADRRRSAR